MANARQIPVGKSLQTGMKKVRRDDFIILGVEIKGSKQDLFIFHFVSGSVSSYYLPAIKTDYLNNICYHNERLLQILINKVIYLDTEEFVFTFFYSCGILTTPSVSSLDAVWRIPRRIIQIILE